MIIEGSDLKRSMGMDKAITQFSEFEAEYAWREGKDAILDFKTNRKASRGFDIIDTRITFHHDITVRNFEEPRRLVLKFQLYGVTQGLVDTTGESFIATAGNNSVLVSDHSNSELYFSSQQNYRCLLIYFDTEHIVRHLSDFESRSADRMIAHLESKQVDTMVRCFERLDYLTTTYLDEMNRCPFQGRLKELYFELKIMELLDHQLNRIDTGTKRPVRVTTLELAKVKDIRQYLAENLDTHHSIADLSMISGLSVHKLKSIFKSTYQVSIFEYQHSVRLNHAHDLLCTGSVAINEISDAVGYSQTSHFIHAFKKKFGYTPSGYRSLNFKAIDQAQ